MQSAPEILSSLVRHIALFLAHHSREGGNARAELGRSFGYFTHHPIAPLNQRRLHLLLEQSALLLPRPARVLELGCGAGILSQAFALQGHRVLGVDPDPSEIKWARQFALEEQLPALFLPGDAMTLPDVIPTIEDTLGGKPDLLLLAYALHHFRDPDAVLTHLSRWLSPGTFLLINEENPGSTLFRWKHQLRTWIQKDTETEWHRTLEAWNAMVRHHGFEPTGSVVGADLWQKAERVFSPTPERRWSLVWSAKKK